MHPVDVIPILGSAASSPTLLAKNVISIGSTSIDAPVEFVTKTPKSSTGAISSSTSSWISSDCIAV